MNGLGKAALKPSDVRPTTRVEGSELARVIAG